LTTSSGLASIFSPTPLRTTAPKQIWVCDITFWLNGQILPTTPLLPPPNLRWCHNENHKPKERLEGQSWSSVCVDVVLLAVFANRLPFIPHSSCMSAIMPIQTKHAGVIIAIRDMPKILKSPYFFEGNIFSADVTSV
jgi:hypothetical protein